MGIKILAGAFCGALCKILCNLVIVKLLRNRGKDFREGKAETCITFLALAATGAAIACLVPLSAETAYLFILMCTAEIIAVTDIHERIIPNDMVLVLMAATVVFGVPSLFGAKGFPQFNILHALLGFAACFVIFSLPAFFSKKVGAGDVKLAAAVGLCLGLWNSLLCVVIMGALVIIYTLAQKQIPSLQFIKSMIPMGPFLSVSMVAVMLLLKTPAFSGLESAFPF